MANVNVTYQEMRDAANRLTRGKEEIFSKLTELQNMVNNLVNGGYRKISVQVPRHPELAIRHRLGYQPNAVKH